MSYPPEFLARRFLIGKVLASATGPVVVPPPPRISTIVGHVVRRVITNVIRVVISPVGRRIDWIAPVIKGAIDPKATSGCDRHY